jgi:tRNA (mo5U34)-methyltransferase
MPFIRFSGLVRKGLRFRSKFEQAKRAAEPRDFDWYPYDCFANLFYMQRLLRQAALSLEHIVGAEPVLDLGAADGALSFFLESLGYSVDACDCSGTNINRMQGLRALATVLGSRVQILDVDVDGRFDLTGRYGAALFLGTLYHLKNPFYALETLAKHARFCFLSTRVARLTADRTVRLDAPVAYLLDAEECNADATNYWIFSPAGLRLLARRAGWQVCAEVSSGASDSDPITAQGDERMFLLLQSRTL